jgi:hypothetical protein
MAAKHPHAQERKQAERDPVIDRSHVNQRYSPDAPANKRHHTLKNAESECDASSVAPAGTKSRTLGERYRERIHRQS